MEIEIDVPLDIVRDGSRIKAVGDISTTTFSKQLNDDVPFQVFERKRPVGVEPLWEILLPLN